MSDASDEYDIARIQAKWLPVWDEIKPFRSGDPDDPRPKKYILDMFPYPSGDLHMGHGEAFSIGDAIARYWVQRGFNVLHPIGWDSFGLPAENAAIKHGIDPRHWTYQNIAQQQESMRRCAFSFDWDRVLHTSDEEYYRWNQWMFLQLYKNGLAYRKPSLVNWCPKDQTVLANEQVVDGKCERCHTPVTKKKLTQWYFKITDYAARLDDDLATLEGHWPDKVRAMQHNWIGQSHGAEVDFVIEGREAPVTVYTTRPDTLFGATFMVVAADSDLAAELVSGSDAEVRTAFQDYLEQVQKATDIERQATDRPKTGVALGRYAVNPVNGERLPIYVSDYVLADYGTGAIMAVPAHDQRDLDFARAFDLPVRVVVDPRDDAARAAGLPVPDPKATGEALAGDGVLVNSGALDGLRKAEAVAKAVELLAERGTGKAATNFRIRDWLISRQRYWGTPIPIVHCPECGEVPVPEDQLPVKLPAAEGLDLKPRGKSPLAAAADWVNVPCPHCGKPARRDADTMDTFVDSSWYYLRYTSPHDEAHAFDPELAKQWLPVAHYSGGVEHAVLHLLYSRFLTKALHDLGYLDFDEPFANLLNQGMVLMDGSKMSKSLGNLVQLGEELELHGVDAVRTTMVFAGPPEEDIDWADVSPGSTAKFLARAWRVARDVTSEPGTDPATGDLELRRATARAVHDSAELDEAHHFNVAIAKIMELVNVTRKAIDAGPGPADPAVREAAEAVAILLSLFAPYTAEDMWALLGHEPSVATAGWPAVDPALLVEDTVTAVVQVKGKVKARLEVSPSITDEDLEAAALADDAIRRVLGGEAPRRVIVRAPKLVNIVPA